MTCDQARRWAETMAAEGCFWAYSDGWLMAFDSELRHVMLGRLSFEQLRGEWNKFDYATSPLNTGKLTRLSAPASKEGGAQ